VPLTPTGPVVRLLVATHPTGAHKPAIGVVCKETVYELFYTTLPPHAFTASDVLQVYLHRGSFETVLSDEDQEQDPDRWVSRSASGQDCWQILSQWIWNLRLELGQHLSPTAMRLMEFAPAQSVEPAAVVEPVAVVESTAVVESAAVVESISYGPPQWAHRSFTKGLGFLRFCAPTRWHGCVRPADHPLTLQERRASAQRLCTHGLWCSRMSLPSLFSSRSVSRSHNNEEACVRVSAVVWPTASSASASTAPPPTASSTDVA